MYKYSIRTVFLPIVLLSLILGMAGDTLAQTMPLGVTIYISKEGSDFNSGSLEKPFATLNRARDELRKKKAASGLPVGATVFLRAGTYFLTNAFTLTPIDSGTEAGPITYTAYPGEKVVLKGSLPITNWSSTTGSVYQANVSDLKISASRFWQLYYRDKRQILARYPNFRKEFPHSGGFIFANGVNDGGNGVGSQTEVQYDASQLNPSKWSRPADARIHIWPWRNWNRNISFVKSIHPEKNSIELAQSASYPIIKGNRFFVENIREELDAPGEWYLDTSAKTLYFWPPDNLNPERAVTAPLLYSVVSLAGVASSSAFVSYIRICHLTIAESTGPLVYLVMAAHCDLIGCTLENSGDTGVSIADNRVLDKSHHNSILGCDISHVKGNGILILGKRDWSYLVNDQICYNIISNNHIHDIGENGDLRAAIELFPAGGGNVTHNNIISHNWIHDTPGPGIFLNGFSNIVEFNRVHHTNLEQSDSGAIGMGSCDIHERGTIIRHNYIGDSGGYSMLNPGAWAYPYFSWGIYLDAYTSGVNIFGNIIVRGYRGGVMLHGGQDNIIENNIFIDCNSQQIEFAPLDGTGNSKTPGNPDKSIWLMTGTRVNANLFSYSAQNAFWLKGTKFQQILIESDRNLVWHNGNSIVINIPNVSTNVSWALWQKLGYDSQSIIADPLFLDAEHNNYALRPDSPALALGFKPIPLENIGLYKTPDRASWPVSDEIVREDHLLYPGRPNPPKGVKLLE